MYLARIAFIALAITPLFASAGPKSPPDEKQLSLAIENIDYWYSGSVAALITEGFSGFTKYFSRQRIHNLRLFLGMEESAHVGILALGRDEIPQNREWLFGWEARARSMSTLLESFDQSTRSWTLQTPQVQEFRARIARIKELSSNVFRMKREGFSAHEVAIKIIQEVEDPKERDQIISTTFEDIELHEKMIELMRIRDLDEMAEEYKKHLPDSLTTSKLLALSSRSGLVSPACRFPSKN